MKRIKTIEIEFNEQSQKYEFSCPYCNEKFVLPDEVKCKHFWFGFESINSQPLGMSQRLYLAIEEKLLNHHTKGPESFSELWMDEYRPEMDDQESYAEEYEDARTECVEYYLDSVISLDDVFWFMDRLPQFKGYRNHATIAATDDCEGNSTSYLFLDENF